MFDFVLFFSKLRNENTSCLIEQTMIKYLEILTHHTLTIVGGAHMIQVLQATREYSNGVSK